MVTTVNATLDDDTADRLRDIKNELGLTWPELIEQGAECLADRGERSANESGPTRSREPSGVEPDPQGVDVDRERLRDALAGSGDVLERRADAILSMYHYLREHGEAEKADLLSVVDVDATGYAGADSVWSNMVKGKDTLASLPGVETPPSGRTTWRYSE